MRRLLLSLALLVPITAEAANNTVLLTPCSSGCVTMRSQDVGGGVESAVNILGDTSGNAIYGTAGTANANVLTVQGIASMTPILANPGTAANWGLGATGAAVPANAIYLGATVGGNLTGLVATSNGLKVDGSAVTQPISASSLPLPSTAATSTKQSDGSQKTQIVDGSANVIASTSNALNVNVTNANPNGQATTANSSPVVIASNQSSVPVTPLSTTNAGAATVKGGVGVVSGGSTYQHIAASQTAAVLQTSTGAIGDYLSHCVIYPSTTAAGSVTVFDNANAAATNVIEFSTGTLSNLAPIVLPVGAVSTAGAWKVTTGANETVVCYGKFS